MNDNILTWFLVLLWVLARPPRVLLLNPCRSWPRVVVQALDGMTMRVSAGATSSTKTARGSVVSELPQKGDGDMGRTRPSQSRGEGVVQTHLTC